ncbi:hypothetical protein VYU27_006958 [Nannochloropsis oceanica]
MSIGGMFLAHELGTDPQFPSFFEVFMQDRIHQSLKPAVRHVFLVLVQRWPQALVLLDHFDEVFAVLSLFLERHYLAKNDALVAESLYGFKRSRYQPHEQTPQQQKQQNASTGMNSNQNTGISSGAMSPLTQMDRRKALLVNILAPYAKAKLDALYTHWKDVLPPPPCPPSTTPNSNNGRGRLRSPANGEECEHDDEELEPSLPHHEPLPLRLRRAFVSMYPLLHASYEGSFFVYQWAYLFGRTKHYSPLLHILGVVLRRLTHEDLPSSSPSSSSSLSSTISPKPTLASRLTRSLKVAFVVAIVAFKVLEWWLSTPELLHSSPRQKRIIPPVPDPPSAAPSGISLPKDQNLCPLCKNVRVNPAVSPAGVAYCYRCLIAHVREVGVCPVTLQACREEQVRRIYLT